MSDEFETSENVVQEQSLTPGTDAYNEAMIKASESGLTGDNLSIDGDEIEPQEERLYANKYKSEADLEKGVLELLKKKGLNLEDYYKELESDLGKKKDESSLKQEEGYNAQDDGAVEPQSTGSVLFDEITKEFNATGNISETKEAELVKLGIPKSIIETHKAGLQALQREVVAKQQAVDKQIDEVAGGVDGFNELMTWAKDNVPQSVLTTLSKAYQVNDADAVLFNLKAIKSQYVEANKEEPQVKLVQGVGSTSVSGDVYKNWNEVERDMKDKRYGKDSSFTKKVAQKLDRSKF